MAWTESAIAAAIVSGTITLIGTWWNISWQKKQMRQQAQLQEERLEHEMEQFEAGQAHELNRDIGGPAAADQIPEIIKGMFTQGRKARSFDRIKSRVRGIDDDRLRQVMLGIGMEAYKGHETGTEYWRFRPSARS